jgi:hypothetical protein
MYTEPFIQYEILVKSKYYAVIVAKQISSTETLQQEIWLCESWPAYPIDCLEQCFSTAGPRPGTGPWHQLYRVAKCSLGICHFSFI